MVILWYLQGYPGHTAVLQTIVDPPSDLLSPAYGLPAKWMVSGLPPRKAPIVLQVPGCVRYLPQAGVWMLVTSPAGSE